MRTAPPGGLSAPPAAPRRTKGGPRPGPGATRRGGARRGLPPGRGGTDKGPRPAGAAARGELGMARSMDASLDSLDVSDGGQRTEGSGVPWLRSALRETNGGDAKQGRVGPAVRAAQGLREGPGSSPRGCGCGWCPRSAGCPPGFAACRPPTGLRGARWPPRSPAAPQRRARAVGGFRARFSCPRQNFASFFHRSPQARRPGGAPRPAPPRGYPAPCPSVPTPVIRSELLREGQRKFCLPSSSLLNALYASFIYTLGLQKVCLFVVTETA